MPPEHMSLPWDNDIFLQTMPTVAPGTALRDGLERILRGTTGALIVVGHDEAIESMCGGGFIVDVEFTATRLRELSKMDGAIILTTDASRIVRAAVHLLPDGSLPTAETGTRHRTADRVSQQSGFPVLSVSKSMNTIALYVNGYRHVLEASAAILSRANQALATMERYKLRLDEVSGSLSALAIEDMVTVRDVAVVTQRLEMVRRIGAEIADYVMELGTDGRMVELQYTELVGGVDEDLRLIVRDHIRAEPPTPADVDATLTALDELSASELLDLGLLAAALGLGGSPEALDQPSHPRGYRLLAKVPRLPDQVVDRLVEHFGDLQTLLTSSADALQAVDRVGDARARSIREALARLAEARFHDRYL